MGQGVPDQFQGMVYTSLLLEFAKTWKSAAEQCVGICGHPLISGGK